MKRNYFLLMSAFLFIATSCGPKVHRYGCRGGGRCITSTAKKQSKKIHKAKVLPTAQYTDYAVKPA